MPTLTLTSNHTLAIEHITNRRMRLVVYQNGEELVCRKENLKQLNEFLNADEANAFKGRLQLFKHQDNISVEVKGQPVGVLYKADIEACLKTFEI